MEELLSLYMASEGNPVKITYLLGAGASAKVLPTVENMRARLLGDEANHIHGFIWAYEYRQKQDKKDVRPEIIKAFTDVGNMIPQFKSPDTLARIYYLSGNFEGVKKVKDILTIYFFFEDNLNRFKGINIDPRYMHFLASIVDHPYRFPENVKVLNWNYDFQMQLAANSIRTDESLQRGPARTPPLFEYYPGTATPRKENNYSLIHLNGSSSVCNTDVLVDSLFHRNPKIGVNELWDELMANGENRYIRFAWEGHDPLIYVKDHLANTDILVVIGYSFPYFNRGTDKKIFKRMTKLKKIYFQSPTLDGQFLFNQFQLERTTKSSFGEVIPGVEIEHVSNCDQFYIPNEF